MKTVFENPRSASDELAKFGQFCSLSGFSLLGKSFFPPAYYCLIISSNCRTPDSQRFPDLTETDAGIAFHKDHGG